MNDLKDVLSWLKTTDLVEVSYKENGKGFSLGTSEAPPAPIPSAVFPSRYECVASPAVGLFVPALGQAKAEEGREVAEGAQLGLIDGGGKAATPVKAPRAGRVARVMIEAGQAVQYGQPLFLIEPR